MCGSEGEALVSLPSTWSFSGSAGVPASKDEHSGGRKILSNGAQRTHRLLTADEMTGGKQARWYELEVHGSIRTLSKAVLNMRHLTALFINHNLIERLPPEIARLDHLTILDVSYNKLSSLPSELGDMVSLMHLNMSNNQVQHLPLELGKLFKLKSLNIESNPLPEFLLSYSSGQNGSKKILQHLLDELATKIRKPPPRQWFTVQQPATSDKPVAEFTVLCYNVLCDKYATTALYSYCPSWALNWEYRKNIIINDILQYNADIVGLHEVEAEQFRVFYEPEMKQHGYDGIFSPKSRAKTMDTFHRKYVDGCSLFWKRDKFAMSKQHLVEFAQVAIHKAHHNEAIINRVMPRDNIALLAMLEVLPGIYRPKHLQFAEVDDSPMEASAIPAEDKLVGSPLVLCAAHTHWDPEFCDVKLVQSMMLTHECAKLIEQAAQKFDIPLQEVPLIICGDFNSLPNSGAVEYLIKGAIPKDHPDLKSLKNNMILNGMNTNDIDEKQYTHSLRVESSINPDQPIFSNITPDFKGMIDYILTTPQSLQRLGHLGGVDLGWLKENNIIGFPHPHVPSDHIPILAQYVLKPLTQRPHLQPYRRFRRRTDSFNKLVEKTQQNK